MVSKCKKHQPSSLDGAGRRTSCFRIRFDISSVSHLASCLLSDYLQPSLRPQMHLLSLWSQPFPLKLSCLVFPT